MEKISITIKDCYTQEESVVKIDFYDKTDLISRAMLAVKNVLENMGVGMSTKKEQTQDLSHQKPEETDNLQKSARPDDTYTDTHELDRDTLGKK